MLKLGPVTCLTEDLAKQVHKVETGQWTGVAQGGVTVQVRGPYRDSAAASSAARTLGGVRGGDYVVYSTGSGKVSGVVDSVASCLGPGTSSYTF